MNILRRVFAVIGFASLVFSVAHAETTLPKVTDPKPATVQYGRGANTAILALPNKATGGEKRKPKAVGPNDGSAASGVAGQRLPMIPKPQSSPTQQ
ncbi:hypothetical protein [Mesorhizobium sp. M0088]|uniref:hypothetical protein n=1 Tax=Mesorhizobium sp. M0088 TaxID=2956873 RepID=UPI00333BE59D